MGGERQGDGGAEGGTAANDGGPPGQPGGRLQGHQPALSPVHGRRLRQPPVPAAGAPARRRRHHSGDRYRPAAARQPPHSQRPPHAQPAQRACTGRGGRVRCRACAAILDEGKRKGRGLRGKWPLRRAISVSQHNCCTECFYLPQRTSFLAPQL